MRHGRGTWTLFSVSLISASLCQAAISNLRLAGTTPAQAMVAYTAPEQSVCLVEVSESETYSPLVHDVDPMLFPGSNRDDREGSLSQGLSRSFVVGKRAAETAVDGSKYSRALRAETTHYYRITCGTDTATGSFRTSNIGWGNTYPQVYPADPSNPGDYAWPSAHPSGDSNEKTVDPLTGLLFTRLTHPHWFSTYPQTVALATLDRGVFDDSAGANWSAADNDKFPAVWTGDGSHQPRLYIAVDGTIAATQFPITWAEARALDYLQVVLHGAATGSGEDAKIVTCLTVDGVTCAPASLNVEQDLSGCGSGCTIGTTAPGLATWYTGPPKFAGPDLSARTVACSYDNETGSLTRTSGAFFGERIAAGSRVWIGGAPYRVAAVGGPNSITVQSGLIETIGAAPSVVFHPFGVLVWKKTTSAHQVTITGATVTAGVGYAVNYWSGADPRPCHGDVVQFSGRDGYHCLLPSNAAVLAWIDAETGDANLLGHLYASTVAGCGTGAVASFGEDANTFYGVIGCGGGVRRLVRCQYTGDNSALNNNRIRYGDTPAGFSTSCTSLTPDSYDLDALIRSFDARYVASQFPAAGAYNATNGLIPINVTSGQDNVPGAWIVMFDPRVTPSPTTNPVVAAYPVSGVGNPYPTPTRGCTNHGLKDNGNSDWVLITANDPAWSAMGAYGTTLAGDVAPADTTIALTAQPAFDQYRPGDVLRINNGSERLLVTEVTDPAYPSVQRGYKNTTPATYSAGQAVGMRCKVQAETGAGGIWWNPLADPHALNASGTTVRQDATMSGGHRIYRSGVFVANSGWGSAACRGVTSTACNQVRIGALESTIGQPYTYALPQVLQFAGQGDLTYSLETHASMDIGLLGTPAYIMDYHQVTAAASTIPTQVSGSLYMFAKTLHRKSLPSEAFCGHHPLLDISGPSSSISDSPSDNYKYCVALNGGECRTGSTAGTVYFNCPYLTVLGCNNGETYNNEPAADVCINDARPTAGVVLQERVDSGHDYFGHHTRLLTSFQQRYRHQVRLDGTNGKVIPNGKFAIYEARWVDGYMSYLYTFQMPSLGAEDSLNRATFVPVTVQLGPGIAGADNVVAEFGYDTNFYCTSRREACVAAGSGQVNETTPFYWASESYSGLSCGAGCTITLPALSQRVLYYRLKFRDASGVVIGATDTSVTTVP